MDNEHAPTGCSLSDYLAILRRRRAIILQAFVLIAIIGCVQALLAKNVYQASAKLLVEGPSYNLNTVDAANPLSSLFEMSQQQTVDTQVEVLQAAPLLDQVEMQAGTATISVAAVGQTNVIGVTAESGDPKVAAAAPNTLLKLFIAQDVENRLGEMEQARQFVLKQGAQARGTLRATESKLKRFKQQSHIAELSKNRDDQIARVNSLAETQQKAQSDLASLLSQIASSRRELAQQPPMTSVRTHTTNTVIAALNDQLRALETQRVGMVQPGGLTPQAPQVKALDAQIASLRQKQATQPLMATSESISPSAFHQSLQEKIADLKAQIPVLETQGTLTNAALAGATAKVGTYAGLELTLDRLTREHDTAQAQDKNFTDQLADLNLREKAHHAAAHVIEAARVPVSPIRPRRMQSILFACLIGLFVGICLALMQEFLDDRINSVDEAGRVLGLPTLGTIPALSASDARLLPHMKGLDPASESYRVLRTNIHFATIDVPARTLMVTSANPSEGKSTTAINLAFAMAMDGRKVILVDTDLRRPALHTLLEIDPVPGLTDVLLGNAPLVPQEVMPGLSILTAGSTPPNPGELLNSRTFRGLVDTLMAKADVVIFDSPPVLAAADAVILAAQMDGTVLVIETGVTKKAAARRTLQLLQQARATVLGIAYNKMRAQDGAGYYYHYQYSAPALGEGHRSLLPSAAPEDNHQ